MHTPAGLAPIAVDESLESLLIGHSTTTHRLYHLTLVIVVGGIGALLTISVDTTVRAAAVLRPMVERAPEARALTFEHRRAAWAVALSETEQRIAELRRDLARLRSDQAAYAVTTPVSGTLDELAPLTPGSTVRAGDPVATKSPDGPLVADVLVPARDVANVRVGMPVRLLIEGYDVQVWGAAAGTVVSVATDYTMSGDEPVFRVRVRPIADSLRRPDGRAVPLKKGQRAQARLLTGRRRITELLLHRAGEWIDPSAPAGASAPARPPAR